MTEEQVQFDPSIFMSESPETLVEEDGSVCIYLFEEINQKSVNRVIHEISKHAGKNIQLQLKTRGGTTEDALALVDVIQQANVQVNVVGYAYSSGFIIFSSAPIRTMTKNAVLMYHDCSYIVSGMPKNHKNYNKFVEGLRKRIINIVTEKTNISSEVIEQIHESGEDWYLDYEEAKSLGLITHVLVEYEETVPEHKVRKIEFFDYEETTAEDFDPGADLFADFIQKEEQESKEE